MMFKRRFYKTIQVIIKQSGNKNCLCLSVVACLLVAPKIGMNLEMEVLSVAPKIPMNLEMEVLCS